VRDLTDWDQIKPLTVMVSRLRTWHRPGLLCIGDAAHAMSPIGGVGINLAIQDAVAAANRLAAQLKHGGVSSTDLAAVQRRREFPTRATQRAQLFAQNRIIRPSLGGQVPATLPWPVRLLRDYPVLRRLPARIVGLGFRPEHVRTPDVFAST
jgi:2-polyprenyl-6-methoxyphenol hydroxylase-like FAD-dependent oxidoreductase